MTDFDKGGLIRDLGPIIVNVREPEQILTAAEWEFLKGGGHDPRL